MDNRRDEIPREQTGRCNRYLKIVDWARDLYTLPTGRLTLTICGKPAKWMSIETLAFDRYLA